MEPHGTLRVITQPTIEPLFLHEVKEALRIDFTDDDLRLVQLIKAARMYAEAFCDLKLLTQTVERSFHKGFPCTDIELNVWPLQSVDSVKYDDTASPSVEQTLTVDSDYYADIITNGGVVSAVTGWPSTAYKPNSVRIRMTAGYTARDGIPQTIKEGMISYIIGLYEGEDGYLTAADNLLWQNKRL